jgi:hypothetical protein
MQYLIGGDVALLADPRVFVKEAVRWGNAWLAIMVVTGVVQR